MIDGLAFIALPGLQSRTADGVLDFTRSTLRSGKAATFAGGAATTVIAYSGPVIAATAVTVVWVGKRTGAGGGNLGRLWQLTTGTTGLYMSHSDNSNLSLNVASGAWTIPLAVNQEAVIGVRLTPASGSVTPRAWIDGRRVTPAGASSGNVNFTGVGMYGNNALSGGTRAFQGAISMGAVFLTELTQNEMIDITLNPWQVFA